MLEWTTNKLFHDETTKKPQIFIPEFVLSQAGYPFEEVKIKSVKSPQNKKEVN